MVGGAGSANAMRLIKEDSSVLKCTVTYSPSMASSAISLARLIAQSKGMSDLVEKQVPASITLAVPPRHDRRRDRHAVPETHRAGHPGPRAHEARGDVAGP